MHQECHPGCDKISSHTGELIFKGMEIVLLTDYKSEALTDRDALKQCCIPPSTHRPTSSTTSSVTMTSNLMLQSCKDLRLGELPGCSGMSGCSVYPVPHFLVISSLILLSTSSLPLACILAVIIFS
jgi:hypothetical protein